ncbi:MAG: hypothetical protein KJI72_03565 [Patescibacteria group bacterium]|nr:hypothetical protein [Patescibacteria group bacterium]
MSFERVQPPDKSEGESKPHRFTREGRRFSMTPEEQKAHEEGQERRRKLEEQKGAERIIESLPKPEKPHKEKED